jgi:hypothetical protein
MAWDKEVPLMRRSRRGASPEAARLAARRSSDREAERLGLMLANDWSAPVLTLLGSYVLGIF